MPRLAIACRPLDDDQMTIARQIGVTDIVTDCPGTELDALRHKQQRVESHGLRLSVIEDKLPMNRIVLGKPDRDDQIEQMTAVIRNMGELGIEVLCYNFMPKLDMTRTNYNVPQRGGAISNGFDWEEARNWPDHEDAPTTDEQQWQRLGYFLERIVPVAEAAGVKLAMHPDDPPIPTLRGMAHIMRDPAAFDRMISIADSPANGLTFCQGCFSEMNGDIPALIHHFADRIHFVHVRDTRGCPTKFEETFHDNGPTDMVAAFEAYRAIGFDGPLRPDHVPLLHGEDGEANGYSFQGRLYAIGFLTGLIQAAERNAGSSA